jgi:DNA-binding transcriptional ArsR family regulator
MVSEKVAATNDLKIDVIQLKKAALILRAINHKLRQQILKLIHQHGKITVTEIYVKLRLEQSVASQHLAILRKAGFVLTVRDGKFIYYSVNYDRLDQVHAIVHELLK